MFNAKDYHGLVADRVWDNFYDRCKDLIYDEVDGVWHKVTA